MIVLHHRLMNIDLIICEVSFSVQAPVYFWFEMTMVGAALSPDGEAAVVLNIGACRCLDG